MENIEDKIELVTLEYNPSWVIPFHVREVDEEKGDFGWKEILTNVPYTQVFQFTEYLTEIINIRGQNPTVEEVKKTLLPAFLLS